MRDAVILLSWQSGSGPPVQGFLVVPASGFKVLQILDLFAVGLVLSCKAI